MARIPEELPGILPELTDGNFNELLSRFIKDFNPFRPVRKNKTSTQTTMPHEFSVNEIHVSSTLGSSFSVSVDNLVDSFEFPNWPGTQSTIDPTFGAILEDDSFEYSDWPGTQSTLEPTFGVMIMDDSFETTDGWS